LADSTERRVEGSRSERVVVAQVDVVGEVRVAAVVAAARGGGTVRHRHCGA
jgi:hypothetical protein